MTWQPLTRGDWTKSAPEDRLDPYLLWADTTEFADFRLAQVRSDGVITAFDAKAHVVPMLIKLKCPIRTGWLDKLATRPRSSRLGKLHQALLDVAPAGRVQPGSRFITLKVNYRFMKLLADHWWLHRWIQRVEMCLAVRPEVGVLEWKSAAIPVKGSLVLGVIDDGCPFARASFLDQNGSTRVSAIWDQSEHPAFASNSGVAHRLDLDALIQNNSSAGLVNEEAVYDEAEYSRVRRRASHGAHVLDMLAGPVPPSKRVALQPENPPTFEPESTNATSSDIVFVQLPNIAVQDNSGKWLGVHILDGLRFICSQASRNDRVVVNISYGPQTGPHDGTALLEQAIDEAHVLIAAQHSRLEVALPAGNSFNNRCHASFALLPGGCRDLSWQVPPNSEAAAFMEIWLPNSVHLEDIRVELEPPSATPGDCARVCVDEMQVWPNPTNPAAAVIFLRKVPQADGRTMVLLALAPTFSFVASRALAPAGHWTVRVWNKGTSEIGLISAQIASNGTDLGASLRGRQSHFSDDCFDPERYLSEAEDDDKPPSSVIQRRRFLSGIATGAETYVYSGYRLSDRTFARYSSSGPSESAYPKNPTWAAVTEETPALEGLRAGGTRSGSTVRLRGTSVAAPQGARRMANVNPPIMLRPIVDPPFDEERGGAGLAGLP
jgi:hypothetical protein